MELEASEADANRVNGIGGEPGEAPAVADALQPQQQQAGAQPPLSTHAQYRDRSDLPDMPGYRLRHTLRGPGGGSETAVACVRFDQAGRRLASGGNDGTAYIWNVDTGELLHTLKGHQGGISDVAWTPDGRYLATASDDTTLRVWDAATGACLRILQGHTHFVFCCAFSSGSNLLVSGGFDELVILWDVYHGRAIKIIPGHSDPVSGVAFSGEPGLHEHVASCSFDGLTRMWDAATGRCEASLTDKANPALSCVRFTPNGKYLLTCTLDSRLLLWDPQSRKVKKTYRGHLNQHTCCQATFVAHSLNQQQRYVACGSEDHHVYFWDLQTKQIAGILRGRPSPDAAGDGHCNTVLTVDAAMAAGRELIASGGHMGDGTIKIWASSQQPVPMEP